jgi:hypothetical protein
MPNTMTLISAVTVGSGGAATIDFTGIPNTYTDLCLKVTGRKTTTGGSNLQMQFNGSTTGYAQRMLIGNGQNVNSYVDNSEIGFMYVNISSDTANLFSNTEIYVFNYATSNNKFIQIDSVTENNAFTTGISNLITAATWSNSAAINRLYLQLANGAGTFAQYSTAHLYGIKKD